MPLCSQGQPRMHFPISSAAMLSQILNLVSFFQNPSIIIPNPNAPTLPVSGPNPSLSLTHLPLRRRRSTLVMASGSELPNKVVLVPLGLDRTELDRFAAVANKVVDDASGEVIQKYFQQKFNILDKEDAIRMTIADQTAEEHMFQLFLRIFLLMLFIVAL